MFKMKTVGIASLLMILLVGVIGCSGGGMADPSLPPLQERVTSDTETHCLWGMWQFQVKPEAGTIDIVPLRYSDIHLNAMKFLEPPPYVNLNVEQVKFLGGTVECVVNVRHPFLGLNQFTGFDVCGILISNGTQAGFSDTGIVMAGEGDTRLLNADGYTRWWNPVEFPVNNGTMFSYQDGILGQPDSVADYNCTVNGYKYFCDALGVNDSMDSLGIETRGVFSAGQMNSRKYVIDISGGLIFNYAVDASWKFPSGTAPWEVPGDFGPGANRPEAYRVNVTETENSLNPSSGGQLGLEIRVYDWTGAESNEVTIESPGAISPASATSASSVGDGYAIFDVLADDCYPNTTGELDVLISVANEKADYQGFIPGAPITSYFIYKTHVGEDVPAVYNLVISTERDSNNLITGVVLDWDDNPGITGYNIYRQDPFDLSDDWVLLPDSPVINSEYTDHDIVGNEGYQYQVVGKVGAFEVSAKSVAGYALLENAEDNENTHSVWEHCAFPLMYNPDYLPQSLFNEFAPLDQTPQNGVYCWDEGAIQNNPAGSPGTYWTGSATLFATPVLPLPAGADTCEAEFCVRLNNVFNHIPDQFHLCGTIVGCTNVVEDGPDNPFRPSQEYVEGLDYNEDHIEGFTDYDNYPNVDENNNSGHAQQYPGYLDIAYAYSKFAIPDVFTVADSRVAFAWACANSAGGTNIPNAGTSFDDIAVLVY